MMQQQQQSGQRGGSTHGSLHGSLIGHQTGLAANQSRPASLASRSSRPASLVRRPSGGGAGRRSRPNSGGPASLGGYLTSPVYPAPPNGALLTGTYPGNRSRAHHPASAPVTPFAGPAGSSPNAIGVPVQERQRKRQAPRGPPQTNEYYNDLDRLKQPPLVAPPSRRNETSV